MDKICILKCSLGGQNMALGEFLQGNYPHPPTLTNASRELFFIETFDF